MSVLKTFGLAGKVAVVTGGAGLFGRQIVEAVAEAGAITYVASRDVAKLQGLSEQWAESGLQITPLPLDQSREESVTRLLQSVLGETGRVDILVNNSVLRPMSGIEGSVAEFSQSMDVNALGLFLMVRTFGQQMAKQGGGSIVNVGSIQGMVGPDLTLYEGLNWGSPPDYFFHKGGLLQLTRYAAALLGPHGVRVNAISPGGMNTGQDQRFVTRYNARTFLGRMANESDLKGAVVFLASDASAYVTGANLPIDGGYTAK